MGVLTGTRMFYPRTAFQLVSGRETVLILAKVALQTTDGTPVVVEGRAVAGGTIRIPWHAIEHWSRVDPPDGPTP